MQSCVNCGHLVSNGDRHAFSQCPPPAKPGKNRRARKRAAARRKREHVISVVRGVPIAGTGKVSASSKQS